MSFANRVLDFYKALKLDTALPKGIEYMNPYTEEYTFHLCEQFYQKYYSDEKERTLLVGINPGRFGSGATGISFTDPIKLENECGIPNTLIKKPELSADFIYAMINEYGGPKKFYRNYFISAVSPLGFTKTGKNINYYDEPALQKTVTPFIIRSINGMINLDISRKKCFCIGEGKNLNFLSKLNDEHHWFEEIVPLAHPRFIMQYKRKSVSKYIDDYLLKLK
ncbi:MAG TPA: uracil-DNA glycosylase family protein [Cyclobacteriaceae bacterium]